MSSEKLTHSEKKRKAIIKASISMFTEQGFEGAKMDDIAERAGVSKQTIYSHFGSKEKLFEGITEQLCSDYAQLFETNAEQYENDPKEGLKRTMCHIMPEICSEDKLSICRLIYASTPRCSKLGEIHLSLVKEYRQQFAAYFQKLSDRGVLMPLDNPDKVAQDFMSLCKSSVFFDSLCSTTPLFTDEELRACAERGVDVFFRAYAPR